MPVIGRRDLLNKLNIRQLREISNKYNIYLSSKTTKTGIISQLMIDLPKSTIEKEVNERL